MGAVAAHFPNQHARDTDTVSSYVPNLLALADLARATVDGLIGIFVGRRAPSPLEETYEVATDLEVTGSRDIPIRTEGVQQPIEGYLGKRPLLTDRGGFGCGARVCRIV